MDLTRGHFCVAAEGEQGAPFPGKAKKLEWDTLGHSGDPLGDECAYHRVEDVWRMTTRMGVPSI